MTMEEQQRIAIVIVALIIMIWCRNQIRTVEYEHISRHVNNVGSLHTRPALMDAYDMFSVYLLHRRK